MRFIFILIIIATLAHTQTNVRIQKENYSVKEDIGVYISDMSRDKYDWIGIYPVGSTNEWENVVSWKWTNGVAYTTLQLPKISKIGNYEARVFFKNSFDVEVTSKPFEVIPTYEGATTLSIKNYNLKSENGYINLSFKNMGGNPDDWIGLYPINSSNEWENIKAWRWIKNMQNNRTYLQYPKNIKLGEYEIRAFFKNSFTLEATSKLLFITPSSNKIELTTSQKQYSLNEPVKVNFIDHSNEQKNWIGIYKARKSTLAENNVAWQWTNNQKNEQLIFHDLPSGKYDVRAFLNNSYEIEELISFEISDEIQGDFPKALLNGEANPEKGVYVKYHRDKAYISISEESLYFDNNKGLTLVDYSDSENPKVIISNPNYYWGKFSKVAQISENSEILTFVNDKNGYMLSLTSNNFDLLDSYNVVGGRLREPNLNKVTGHNLFYTSTASPIHRIYHYYHINLSGIITKIDKIDAGGANSSNYIVDQGIIGNNQYYITYRKTFSEEPKDRVEDHKKIYNISNLPIMTLIDTIISDVQP